MREKLKKDKEEAEKKRLAEENAAAEAKSRDPYSQLSFVSSKSWSNILYSVPFFAGISLILID